MRRRWLFPNPVTYMGKTTDTFGGLKFRLPQNSLFEPKLGLKLDRFHGRFLDEKYSIVFLWNPWNVLTSWMRRRQRRKDTQFFTSGVGPI